MKIKIFFLGMISLLVISQLQAQQSDSIAQSYVYPRHECQFGIGDPLIMKMYSSEPFIFFDVFSDEQENWFAPDTYRGMRVTTCPLTFSHMFRVKKWFWVGGLFSYTGIFNQEYDRATRDAVGYTKEHFFAIAPAIRFSWVNTKYVTMYSGISLGVMFSLLQTQQTKSFDIDPFFQLTSIGVSVGKKWYGFSELGIGAKGIVTAGFGYRFNVKK